MTSASPEPRNGSMRSRRLAGVVALVALTLAAAGCSLFSDDDSTSTPSTTTPAGTGEELTDADAALCQVADALREGDPEATFGEALTGTDDDARHLVLAIGLFVGSRDDDVRRLGAYEPGIRAIDRRWDRLAEVDPDADADPNAENGENGDRPLPTVTSTPTEGASIEAADRFLADDRCPA